MGTQQILLIVLSVIIVGIAVAVGITMFNTQAVNSNRDACIADMNNFAAQASAYYKTPTSHGGCGSAITAFDEDILAAWIGFTADVTGSNHLKTGNGEYVILETSGVVKFTATGTGGTSVKPETEVILATGIVSTVANPVVSGT